MAAKCYNSLDTNFSLITTRVSYSLGSREDVFVFSAIFFLIFELGMYIYGNRQFQWAADRILNAKQAPLRPCAFGPIYVFDVDCIKYSVTNPRAYGYGLCVRVPSLYPLFGSLVFKASSIKWQIMNDYQKVFQTNIWKVRFLYVW